MLQTVFLHNMHLGRVLIISKCPTLSIPTILTDATNHLVKQGSIL